MRKNLDYEAYMQNGIGDAYLIVGDYNLFMQCDTPNKTAIRELPHGFSFRLCRRDELDEWKRVVVEEQYVGYVAEYADKALIEAAMSSEISEF